MKLLDFPSVPDGGWYFYPPLLERRGSIKNAEVV